MVNGFVASVQETLLYGKHNTRYLYFFVPHPSTPDNNVTLEDFQTAVLSELV